MSKSLLVRLAVPVLLVFSLMACGGSGSGPTPPPTQQMQAPVNLSYPSPQLLNTGTQVSGLTPSVTGTVSSYAVTPALPPGLSLNPTTGKITGAPTQGTPTATYNITASNSAGATSFGLVVTVSEGPVGEIKLQGTTSPVVQVSNTAPASGQTVTVTVSLSGAESIALTPSGSGCGGITAMNLNDSSLQETAAVGSTGRCVLEADIVNSSGTQTYTNEFMVAPTNLPSAAAGISFVGGVYVPSGELSFFPPSQTLTIQTATAPQNFINGGTGSIYMTPSDPNNVLKAVVSFAGIPGYYIAPVTLVNGQYRIDLSISQNFMAQLQKSGLAKLTLQPRPKTPHSFGTGSNSTKDRTQRELVLEPTLTGTLSSLLQLMALDGSVSPGFPLSLSFQSVGSGPIQVSLSWGQPVDLDLHVVPPSGEEIYYAHRCDATGGCLDLDSNPACQIDNIDNENIVWPDNTNPDAGQYTVRVDYYDNCDMTTPIPYTVRVTNCGNSTTYTGSAATADFGGEGSGATITTFTYTPCAGFSVSGSATYEDYAPTLNGLSNTPQSLPIRYAKVEVHQSSDDSVLQTGNTDATGAYSMTFSMATPGPYYVKVLSTSLDSGSSFMQTVQNNQGTIYSAKSDPVDASMTPNATGVNIASKRSDSYAGAFNIFDVGVNASNFVLATYGATLPMLTWQWTSGVPTCGGAASCFDPLSDTIYVLSSATDTDEYDDSVLAHEFGHFHSKYLTRQPSGSGAHSPSMQVAPNLAWSEGLATFFGQSVLSSPIYLDSSSSGIFSLNLETPESNVPPGTSDGTLSGNVSEATDYALLWDLSDNAKDSRIVSPTLTVKDVINNTQAVFSDLSSLKATTHDRGGSGVDLVDFLDQWLCSGYSMWDPMAGDNFNGLVTQLNQFPFSPQQPANCN